MKPQNDNVHDPIAWQISEIIANILSESKFKFHHPYSPEEILPILSRPPQEDMGDYALPCFQLAKTLKRPPIEIGQSLLETLKKNYPPILSQASLAGAFLNFYLNPQTLAQTLLPEISDNSYFEQLQLKAGAAAERVMVEFSQPNTHKEFHIGHGRNVSLGDSLCHILRYSGFEVIAANYIGDEGTHVAKCLWQLELEGQKAPQTGQANWYGAHYVRAHTRLNTDEENKSKNQKEISNILTQLEQKSGPAYELWLKSRQDCLEDFDRIYKILDVEFDHVFYESELSQLSQDIVDEFVKKELFYLDAGTYGVSLEDYKLGYFMARKSDGTTPYITKDLALAKVKFENFQIERSIYVVGSEQNFHFQQLFKTLELMKFPQASKCYHLSYAHVTLPEGKMSSRAGNSIALQGLIQMVEAEIQGYLDKYREEWEAEEIGTAKRTLTLAAIKYSMLAMDPQKEIVFDPKAWTSFEGQSGPYLIYCYARIKSIIRTCNSKGYYTDLKNITVSQAEHSLIRQMYDFNGVVHQSAQQYRPAIVAGYLYQTCKIFNRYYAKNSVLRAETPELRNGRLACIEGLALILKKGLKLLGINTIERM